MDCEQEFYRIATLAIRARVLTAKERDMISRVGTRKQGYWSRHLYDLCVILNRRQIDSALRQEITRWLTPQSTVIGG